MEDTGIPGEIVEKRARNSMEKVYEMCSMSSIGIFMEKKSYRKKSDFLQLSGECLV